MKFIADLHIHSRFSRATSRTLTPESLSLWGQKKGIKVIGTGDFTHPEWVRELKEKFTETEKGLFSLKPEYEREIEGEIPSSCVSKTLFIKSSVSKFNLQISFISFSTIWLFKIPLFI